MPMYRKLAPTVLKVAVLAIIVVFIVRNIPLKLEDLTSFLVHANDRFYLSLLLFSIFLMLQAGIWVLIVNASLSDTGRLSDNVNAACFRRRVACQSPQSRRALPLDRQHA